jgi:hypothetical protein
VSSQLWLTLRESPKPIWQKTGWTAEIICRIVPSNKSQLLPSVSFKIMSFEVFTQVNVYSVVIWVMVPCDLTGSYWCLWFQKNVVTLKRVDFLFIISNCLSWASPVPLPWVWVTTFLQWVLQVMLLSACSFSVDVSLSYI